MKKTLLIGITLVFCFAAMGQSMTEEEIDHKADVIIKIIQFGEWPETAKTDADGNIVINVVGDSPLTSRLEELAKEESAKGTPVVVKVVSIEDDIAACQILFMATKETADLAKVLKKVDGKPCFTVSDAEYFARYGVMVNFVTVDGKTKFEVNRTTMKMSGLKMSSKMLKMAVII